MSDVYEMFKNLPFGWSTADLGDLLERITNGLNANQSKIPVGTPISRIETISQGVVNFERVQYVTDVDEKKFEHFSLRNGDILFSHINSDLHLGKTAVFQSDKTLLHGINLLLLRTKSNLLNPKYLHYILNLYRASGLFMAIAQHAVNQSSLNQTKIKSLKIPLPPRIGDQQQIVAEIEKQFSRLDEAVASLKRIQANLKRYKAAVLKAVVEGKLTEQWRKDHPDVEPADQLLKRILAERRAKWEAEELAKMKAKGIKPKDDLWKKKYKEPAGPETANLPELPEGWVWTTLDALLVDIQAGKSFKCDERKPENHEIGVVKVSAVSWGEYDEYESKTCVDLSLVNPNLYVNQGDLLFSRANTIELVGACVIAKKVTKNIMLSDKILRFKTIDRVDGWILHCLRSRFGRSEIERLATGNQESMRNIGQERIRSIRIALPPSKEWAIVLEEIDRRLSVTEELETTIKTNLKRAERMRQTILQKAFSSGFN